MNLEYNINSRSSQHYAATNWLFELADLCAMRALGYWPSPDSVMDEAAQRFKKTSAMTIYRANAGWWYPNNCGYQNEPISEYWGNQYWPTLKSALVDDLSLEWPSNS